MEAAPNVGPVNPYQVVIDKHLEAITTDLEELGVTPRSVIIGVRLTEPFEEAGNDAISAYRIELDDDEDLKVAIVDHLRRMTRAVLRTMPGFTTFADFKG